ncbi:hypothetical protein BAMA_16260 [Bacillus manliponensis]|uniref:Uncharacterized protein n=1 Tax=Bacillus manliponensis TaxID=574376 RepID=A0A073JSS6_9BACI|nr:hypothetical protein [Bacillus manliponensis]KEK17246.1 hypothetical protein BAMA_16260 [Bacillus manliponensis]
MKKKLMTALFCSSLFLGLAACDSEESSSKEKQANATETSEASQGDKDVYQKEVKAEINSFVAEYDAIWNEHWKPVWTEASENPNMDQAKIKEQMETIQTKYTDLSTRIKASTINDKLSDETIKEDLNTFKKEFSLAAMYRSDAARNVVQGIDGLAPMNDRMEAAKKNVELSDEKMMSAVAATADIEVKLGSSK